jgi:hypothetical protein
MDLVLRALVVAIVVAGLLHTMETQYRERARQRPVNASPIAACPAPKPKHFNAVAHYLYRNRSRMRYDEYLANGGPIASGPVEGAC